MLLRLVLTGCLVAVMAAEPLFAQTPKKYALLAAITTYEHAHLNQSPKIQYPEADARAIGDVLKSAGYDVELLLGEKATKDALDNSLTRLAKKGNQPGVILIGFFGHGVEYDESDPDGKPTSRSYFCPYDCTMRNRIQNGEVVLGKDKKPRIEPDPETLISMSRVFEAMSLSPAGNRVLLADCCRNDPHAARAAGRGFGTGVKSGDLPENANTAALFACSKGEQALEDSVSGHGVFTKCVLDWLQDPQGKATANELGLHVSDAVPEAVTELTMGRQFQNPKFLNAGKVDLLLVSPGDKKLITNSIGMKLVLIPPGEFLMGSPDSDTPLQTDAGDEERPQHKVKITKPFYLGQTEVTQGQWKTVMGTEPWTSDKKIKEGADYPATQVPWNDAVSFCEKLSEKEGKTYQLPTEAEWEFACRGGTKTRWSFGNDRSELSNYGWWSDLLGYGNSEGAAHRVGQKKANPFGLFDMHGNAFEWCRDVYDERAYRKRTGLTLDPVVNTGSDDRVLRGGAFLNLSGSARSSYRTGMGKIDGWGAIVGFRVSRTK